jgi:indolepyruvate ferredoxin oxidoreductase
VDPSRGDKITYKHFNRPDFDVWGLRIRFDLDSRDWMLKAMKRMKFLRPLLPGWHAKEKAFRDWYEGLVDRFVREGKAGDYDAWVKALSLPEEVRGYREVRYPKMERAYAEAKRLLDPPTSAPSRKREPVKA